MDDNTRKLGLEIAEKLIKEALDGITNPTLYDPMKKKYQTRLSTGMDVETAKAALPKVLPPVH